jgi:hypothetical protein
MNYTPGPWESFGKVVRGKGRFICRVNHQDIADEPLVRNETDDARLIAAAPELLEACKAAMLLFDGHESRKDSAVIAQLPQLLKAAIQKAEGA